MASISSHSVVSVSDDQVFVPLAGEVVILNLQTGLYYGLNATGRYIWDLLQTPTSFGALRDAVVHAYDVAPERCERDLMALLQELADDGMVQVADGPGA